MNTVNRPVALLLLSTLLPLLSAQAHAALLKVRKVFTGDDHACAVLKDKRIKCWGDNAYGQLGLGDFEDRGDDAGEMGNALPFVDLGPDIEVRQLALGRAHSCALYGANSVKCWGSNEYGQLGLGDTVDHGGYPDEMGNALPLVRVTEDQDITSLVAGSEHTCALLEDGSVRCWGRNQYGQLGLGHVDSYGDDWAELIPDAFVYLGPDRTAVQIAAGYAHTCALLDDATIKCWGWNDYGQLGIGSTFERGDSAFEMGSYLQAVDFGVAPGSPISVGAGSRHSCALFDNGTVRCWGEGQYGVIGVGNENTIGDESTDVYHKAELDWDMEPVSLLSTGGFHNCVKGTAGIACWGMNVVGQLGNGRGDNEDVGDGSFDVGIFLRHTEVGSQTVSHLDTGWMFSCARFFVERIKCWGYNTNGQLGLGDVTNRGVEAADMGDALPFIDLGNDGGR